MKAQSYDANGNLVSITPPGQPAHVFNYNSVDKETDYTPPNVAGVAEPTTTYDYDRDRKLTTITRPDGQQLTFTYQVGNSLLDKMTTPSGDYVYGYNTDGNVTSISAPNNEGLIIAYDGILPLSQTWSGSVSGVVSQRYNNYFLANQQCINSGSCIDYLYDNDNLLTQAGALTIAREAQKGGLINSKDLSNLNEALLYNSFGEMVSDIVKFNDTELYNATYTRDKLGRITTRSQILQSGTELQGYGYNDAGRLETVTQGSTTITYTYDDNGNRLSKQINDGTNTTTETATYDEQDRLLTYDNCTFAYTNNGELKKRTCGADITTYDYDVLGNLRSVTLPNATKIDYVIDGQSRRVGKKVAGTLHKVSSMVTS